VKIGEIYRRMTVQYGDNCVNQREVYGWVERFKGGRTSVAGYVRCGLTSTVTCWGWGADWAAYPGQPRNENWWNCMGPNT